MNTSRRLKILWAIDAFDDLKEVQQKQVEILKGFAKNGVHLEINPIYVLSPRELGISDELSESGTDTYQLAAKKALAQRLEKVTLPGLNEPQILVQHRPSLRASAESLAKFGAAGSYDLILVGSHGRKGFQRMMMGSFAEALLLKSKTPVLLVGSQAKSWNEKSTEILVPNDFSDSHSPLFSEVFQIAESLSGKATLLNVIPKPLELVLQSGVYLMGGGYIPVPIYTGKRRAKHEEVAEKILSKARKHGVPCEVIIDDDSASITESVLKHAELTHASFIAMEAQSGPLANALVGSITRQVARLAPCPVLIFRFQQNE